MKNLNIAEIALYAMNLWITLRPDFVGHAGRHFAGVAVVGGLVLNIVAIIVRGMKIRRTHFDCGVG
jgi:hypothetical protein